VDVAEPVGLGAMLGFVEQLRPFDIGREDRVERD
jgi:hypothetical protein